MKRRRSVRPAGHAAASSDRATRERLLEAATDLFAAHGFKRVTIRQICQAAHANIAAVNYHFGDKEGLYRAIFDGVVSAMQETNAAAFEAGAGSPPADRLRVFVRTWLRRVTASPKHLSIHRLMTRELEDPTGALDRVFEQVIEPRQRYLGEVIAALAGIPPDDARVLRASASVLGQCLVFARPLPLRAPAHWQQIVDDVDAAADHIADFSLAGIQAIAARTGSS